MQRFSSDEVGYSISTPKTGVGLVCVEPEEEVRHAV